MATIPAILGGIKQQLDRYLSPDQIHELCRQQGHRFRNRLLPPALSVHLLCLQILAQVALENLRLAAGRADLTAQAICKARRHLPLAVLLALVRLVAGRMNSWPCHSRFHDHRIILADGTTLLTADTPELAHYAGRAQSQYGVAHNDPRIRLLAVLDYATGMILEVLSMPRFRHEITGLHRLFKSLSSGDLILGDRGLVNYVALALMLQQGLQGCFRLPALFWIGPQARPRGRRIHKLSCGDYLVCWLRPKACRWISKRRLRELPETLLLRQIEYRIIRPGFKTTQAWLITTLVDPRKYPAEDLVALYEKRWQVELCFRNIKSSLKIQGFRAKTLPGIRKEIAGMLLLYNLVRQVMLQAAGNQHVAVDRISFKNALNWLLFTRPGETLARLKVNPTRRRPSEPRMLKRRTVKYTPLKVPRCKLQLPPPIYQFIGVGLS